MNPMKLIRQKDTEESRQEREMRKIRERQAREKEWIIDASRPSNPLPVDQVLNDSYRKADNE